MCRVMGVIVMGVRVMGVRVMGVRVMGVRVTGVVEKEVFCLATCIGIIKIREILWNSF